jgi:SAM-dependent methyltransferase
MTDQNDNNSLGQKLMRRLHAPIYEKRIAVLSETIVAQLKQGDVVLDVGCGSGSLGKAILNSPRCPAGVRVRGLENHKRGGEAIEVTAYDGHTIPFADREVDVVILADVLHHEPTPQRLLNESIRVARRCVFIKDHKVDGFLAQSRISFLDWAANTGYGVKCLFRYHTRDGWTEFLRGFPVKVAAEILTMNLYPPFFNFVFGKRLHYCAVLETPPQK